MVRSIAMAALAAAMFGANHASAADQKVYDGLTVQETADLLQEAGYRAQVESDSEGKPYIDSKASGYNYQVYFYGCEGEPARCEQIQLSCYFSEMDAEDQAKALKFNEVKVFGRVYNYETDTYIEHPIHLNGGVTGDNLVDNFELWDDVLTDFKEHMGW